MALSWQFPAPDRKIASSTGTGWGRVVVSRFIDARSKPPASRLTPQAGGTSRSLRVNDPPDPPGPSRLLRCGEPRADRHHQAAPSLAGLLPDLVILALSAPGCCGLTYRPGLRLSRPAYPDRLACYGAEML